MTNKREKQGNSKIQRKSVKKEVNTETEQIHYYQVFATRNEKVAQKSKQKDKIFYGNEKESRKIRNVHKEILQRSNKKDKKM